MTGLRFVGRPSRAGALVVCLVALLLALSPARHADAASAGSGSSVVVTQLNLASGGQGYLVFQVQVDADDPLTSFDTWIGSGSPEGRPLGTKFGYWAVSKHIGSAALGIICDGSDPQGNAVVSCKSTTPGESLPAGRYDVSMPITRIGPLLVHAASLTYSGRTNGWDSYPINEPGGVPPSTAEVRQVVVDPITQQADLPLTLQVKAADVIDSVWITLSSRDVWVINTYHRAILHGLMCRTNVDVGTEAVVCTGPGGGPLPVGQTSIVLPLIAYGPASERMTFGDVTLFRDNNTVGENVDTFPFV